MRTIQNIKKKELYKNKLANEIIILTLKILNQS